MASLARVRLLRLRVPLKVRYRLALRPVEYFDTIVVECEASDGRTGLGEATVLTGYTDETIDGSCHAGRELGARLAKLRLPAVRRLLEPLVKDRPFTTTAFLTATEMLQGSEYLQAERERLQPYVVETA